jgi:hypothetical protein
MQDVTVSTKHHQNIEGPFTQVRLFTPFTERDRQLLNIFLNVSSHKYYL